MRFRRSSKSKNFHVNSSPMKPGGGLVTRTWPERKVLRVRLVVRCYFTGLARCHLTAVIYGLSNSCSRTRAPPVASF
jgi:hypothetical protein